MLLSDPPTAWRFRLGGVTRCIISLHVRSTMAHCTSTCRARPLPSRCLFLNRASVLRHIAASKNCRAADLGYREIHVEARAGDLLAGGGGAAGPPPDVRHQPPGDTQATANVDK